MRKVLTRNRLKTPQKRRRKGGKEKKEKKRKKKEKRSSKKCENRAIWTLFLKFSLAVNDVFFDETSKSGQIRKFENGRKNFGSGLNIKNVGKTGIFFWGFTSQSEAGGRTEGRHLSTKTSPKGEFECLKATSTKCE